MTDVNVISNANQLVALANLILDPSRGTTIVVVSVARETRRPRFDLKALAGALSGADAAVHVLADPWDGDRLHNLTGGLVTCYNGAAASAPARGGARTFLDRDDGFGRLVDWTLARSSFVRRPDAPAAAGEDGGEVKRLKGEIKRLKGELRRARAADAPACVIPPSDLFPAGMEDEWAAIAVRVAWALATSAPDKRERPLPADWRCAEGYAASLAGCQWKADVIRCMVRVLLGVDDHHALHDGNPGAPIVRGPWGNPVWRACVKQGSPNAPRVHYTRDGAGAVVFLGFGGHDDLL